MKYLTVIRHAKPVNQQLGEDDQTRRLTEDGAAEAFRLGQLLAEKGCVPDLVLTSPAQRAQETTTRICRAMNLGDGIVKVIPVLYSTDVTGILEILKPIPEQLQTVFVIGHNPTLTHLVNSLCGPVVDSLNAGSAACVELDKLSSEENSIPNGSLVFHIEPE